MKIKVVGFLLFFLTFLFNQNAAAMGSNSDLPKEIFKHWVHSYEEDTKEFSVYRVSGYDFPLSRGRMGFEIKEDGKFIFHFPGPDDRTVELQGYWKIEGKDKIIGYCEEDGKLKQRIIDIVACSDDVLKVKK